MKHGSAMPISSQDNHNFCHAKTPDQMWSILTSFGTATPARMNALTAQSFTHLRRYRLPSKTYSAFPHRQNPDGTFDSICTQCFKTIATTMTEAELTTAERTHNCEGPECIWMQQATGHEQRQIREPGGRYGRAAVAS
jgi:hypothetical protein